MLSFVHAAANIFGFFQSIPNSCIPSNAMPDASKTKDAAPQDARAPNVAPAAVPAPGIIEPATAPAAAVGSIHLIADGRKDAMDSTNISGIAAGLSNNRLPIASRKPSDLVDFTRFMVELVGNSSISDATSINLCISSASKVLVKKSGV